MNHNTTPDEELRRELQRRIFSADVDSSDVRTASRLLRELERNLSAQAASDAPVEHIEAASEAPVATEPSAEPSATENAVGFVQRFRMAWVALGVTAAFAIGLALGATAVGGAALGQRDAGGVTAAGAESSTRPVVDSSKALALFDAAQTASDIPAEPLPATLIVGSVRRIGDPFFGLFVGLNAANMVCLLAVQPADSFAMSCVTIDEFPSTGIRLEWASELEGLAADGSSTLIPSTVRATWRPNGSLDIGGGPR